MDFAIRPVHPDDAEGLSALIRGLGLFRRLESEDPDVTPLGIPRELSTLTG